MLPIACVQTRVMTRAHYTANVDAMMQATFPGDYAASCKNPVAWVGIGVEPSGVLNVSFVAKVRGMVAAYQPTNQPSRLPGVCRWQVAGGRWQVAGGRWQVAGAVCCPSSLVVDHPLLQGMVMSENCEPFSIPVDTLVFGERYIEVLVCSMTALIESDIRVSGNSLLDVVTQLRHQLSALRTVSFQARIPLPHCFLSHCFLPHCFLPHCFLPHYCPTTAPLLPAPLLPAPLLPAPLLPAPCR